MNGTGCRLLIVVCTALCGAVTGDISSYSTPQNEYIDHPQTEVSPVQLEISLPIAAEQLLQLAGSASPDVWRHVLTQTPDAARRALLAQLRGRRRLSGSRDHSQQRADGSRDRHQQRAGDDLASRWSPYKGQGVESVTRRAYSTLERDSRGRRRVSSRRPQPSPARHQTQTNSPPLRATSYASRQSGNLRPPSRDYEGLSSSYRPAPSDEHRQTSSQRPPSNVFNGPSFAQKSSSANSQVLGSDRRSDLSSSYSSWDASLPPSRLRPRSHFRSNSVSPDSGTILRSQSGPSLHGGSPPVTTYRPRWEQVTTYRPRLAEVTTHRRGRAEMTTYRPAPSDVRAPTAQSRRFSVAGHMTQDRHQHSASEYSSEQEQDHHQEHEGLQWLRDVVPGVPGEDYPVLDGIPVTSFSCAGRPHGYYSDVSARCQAYHVCHGAFQMSSFICPNGTVFSQSLATCDWWFNTECSDDLPLTSSVFRVSRQTSRFMFEDDWVDDYEDFDVTDTNQLTEAHSRHRTGYREPKAARRKQQAPSTAQRRRPGDYSAPGGSDRSASSGKSHSAAVLSSHSAAPGTNEAYRRPERHLSVRTPPPGEHGGNYPADEGKQRQTRRTKTSVTTLKTPKSGDEGQKSAVSRPFVINVSYGGKSGRTTKELKFGPEAARNFLSRAQARRWSFTGGSSLNRRIGITETAEDPEEQLVNTSRGTRVLEKVRDKVIDFEIGRRNGQALVGSESRVRERSVLPQDVTNYRSGSSGASRQVFYRPPPTRPMVRPAYLSEVAPPETSVEPPTEAKGADSADSRAERRGTASVRDRRAQRSRLISEGSTIPSLTQEESQREEAPSDGRGSGGGDKLSFAELTTDDPGSLNGGNELVADDSVDFDYNVLLNSASFKNFGLKLPSAPSPNTNRQSPG